MPERTLLLRGIFSTTSSKASHSRVELSGTGRHRFHGVPYRRVALCGNICLPNRDNTLTVKCQRSDSRSASGRQSHEEEIIGRPNKVVVPHMQPRVEQRNHGTILGISGSHLGGLTAITVKAG
jgi:hypothetical protein